MAPTLWHAVRTGNTDQVSRYLGQNRSNLEARDSCGRTPLLFSLHQDIKQEEVASFLLRRGANPNVANTRGWTPLMLACRYNLPDIAKMLVESGAQLNARNNEGFTPLALASLHGPPDLVELLLKKGASIELAVDDWTPLMIAARYGRTEVLRVLLQCGAKVDVLNKRNNTALNLACQDAGSLRENSEMFRCVKALYQAGASLEVRNSYGRRPIETAEFFRRGEVVEFLEFIQDSEIAQVVGKDLGLPRKVLVAFFEEQLLHPGQYAGLRPESLQNLGIQEGDHERFLRRFDSVKLQGTETFCH